MTWWTIAVALRGADSDLVAAELVRSTGQAVEERDDAVMGFALDEASARRARVALEDRFGEAVVVTPSPTPVADWSTKWREGLSVRRIGRLEVGPSWLLAVGPNAVVIDPETAFGSGEHGSTRGALALIDRHLKPSDRVLDLGSGSGVLAIGAVKLGARSALGIEVDDDAAPIADGNALRNAVADRVRFVTGDAAVLAPLAGPVELVVSNILRHVNVSLLDPIARSLVEGGVAVFAGMEQAEAPLFRPELANRGFRVVDEVIDEGWWSVAATR